MYYLYEHICGHDLRVFSFLLTAAYSLLGCVGPLMDVFLSIGLSLFMFAFRNTLISPTLSYLSLIERGFRCRFPSIMSSS